MDSINKKYIEIKAALKKRATPDTYFPAKYSFSPYQACEHSCKYCDGRAEKYYVQGNFEKDIVIRKNIPQVLNIELKKIREKGLISIGSGVSDPYQPVEKDEKITRKALEIIYENGFPCSIMTKSSLVTRDLDIIEKINRDNGFYLMISITSLDDNIRKVFEPNASSFQERVETLKLFKERGIRIGALAMPFLPFITDAKENITKLFDKLKEIQIDFIMPGGLTLRPGIQKSTFLKVIEEYSPDLLEKYNYLYHENKQSGSPINSRTYDFYNFLYKTLSEYNIPYCVPHYILKNNFTLYDELFIILNNLKDLYSNKKINTTPLEEAIKNYNNWLTIQKDILNKNRKLNYKFIEHNLLLSLNNKEFDKIINNSKLIKFIIEVIINRKTFNYLTLKFD